MQIKYAVSGQGAAGAAGPIGINWISGGWLNTANYAVRDAVEENGSSFFCKVANGISTTVIQPGVTSGWETYWDVIASGGPPSWIAWNDRPAANTVPFGTIYGILPASLIGTGKNPAGILIQSDGALWRPLGGAQKIAFAYGTEETPIATKSATTADVNTKYDVGTDPALLIGMMYLGSGVRVKCVYKKTSTGAVDTELKAYLGRDAASASNSAILAIVSTGVSAATRSAKIDQTAIVTITGAYNDTPASRFTTDSIPVNTATSDVLVDRDGAISTGALNYVTFWDKPLLAATESRALISYEVWWVG